MGPVLPINEMRYAASAAACISRSGGSLALQPCGASLAGPGWSARAQLPTSWAACAAVPTVVPPSKGLQLVPGQPAPSARGAVVLTRCSSTPAKLGQAGTSTPSVQQPPCQVLRLCTTGSIVLPVGGFRASLSGPPCQDGRSCPAGAGPAARASSGPRRQPGVPGLVPEQCSGAAGHLGQRVAGQPAAGTTYAAWCAKLGTKCAADVLVDRIVEELFISPPRTLKATGLDAIRLRSHLMSCVLEEMGAPSAPDGRLPLAEQTLLAVAFSSRAAWATLERIVRGACGSSEVNSRLTGHLLDAFKASVGQEARNPSPLRTSIKSSVCCGGSSRVEAGQGRRGGA